jgi:hypothetical protein
MLFAMLLQAARLLLFAYSVFLYFNTLTTVLLPYCLSKRVGLLLCRGKPTLLSVVRLLQACVKDMG